MAIAAITLRPTTEADLPFVLAAEGHADNAPYVETWSPQRHGQACTDANEGHWIVVDDTGAAVGYTILVGLTNPHHAILVQRLVITAKGRGYGRATLIQLLHLAFHQYQAHRVWLDVVTTNQRARHLYDSVGFIWEGCLREAVKAPDGYRSMDVMAMLRSEFLARYGAAP